MCKNMKLCLIYNYAQHYRSEIFSLISKTFDCDFVFGDYMADVKKMDYSLLRGNVTENRTYIFRGCSFQKGMLRQLFKNYTHYILLGDTRSISTWLFVAISRLFYPEKKIYYWTHGWYGKETILESALKKIFYRLPNGGIFTYGNYARELMINKGFDPSKIHVIYNSLSYDSQIKIREKLRKTTIYADHFGNSNSNLFFIGRLTPIKKLDQILYAMHKCRQKGYRYNLTLIGSGEKLEYLKNVVKCLGLEECVWFYGSCYNEIEISNMIYNADLCVAPGNVGLTAMHSLVFGTPVITHNDFKWQMPEFESIKEDLTGTFFEIDNIDDLSNRIINWFSKHSSDRQFVRDACTAEIDRRWNPYNQIQVLKNVLYDE